MTSGRESKRLSYGVMVRSAWWAAVVAAVASAAAAAGPETKTGFLERSVRVGETSHAYKVYVPPAFDPGKKWPVMLYLHGAGERGTDGVRQTEVGLGPVLRSDPGRYPAVIVFPQAPPGGVWLGELARVATAALDQTIAEFSGDPSRVYLSGLSMGAYGSWVLAFERPEKYAAIVSVSGGIVPPSGRRARLTELPPTLQAEDPYAATAARVKDIPAWLFHGAVDPTVPVSESRQLAAALKQVGCQVRYTEYEGVAHNAWDRAFAEPELATWLLAQRRGGSRPARVAQ
jgi:predicted peptidase